MESPTIEEILEAYFTCALWSSIDHTDQPMDDNYSLNDIATPLKELAFAEINCWLGYCNELGLIEQFLNHPQTTQATRVTPEKMLGHDFWLTRNGHGSGFWDRGLGQLGNDLTDATKTFGTMDLYVGDDNKIYA
ncbi:hypothetical protein Lepto7375DRAFT_7273 [Leptolyngbya sp. PCC 7375]|nr:hypothetical protein Lepto7375DRAFT_7273 [Leptolyngbya sp. PCC 7375]